MRRKYLFRILLVIPLVFFQSILTVIGERVPLPAEDMLLYSVAGSVTDEFTQAVVLATGQIVFLFLFLLLFGDFLSEQLRTGAVYQFSRLPSRKSWYIQQIGWLIVYAAGYAILYIGLHAIVALIISDIGPGVVFPVIVLKLICIYSLLMILFGILCNWLCSITGVASGVVISMILTAICAVTAAQMKVPTFVQLINPAHYPMELFYENGRAFGKVLILLIETIVLIVPAGFYYCRKDIYPAEGEG